MRVTLLEQSDEDLANLWVSAVEEYDEKNTTLYFLILPSLVLTGDHEKCDMEEIQKLFVYNDMRDGSGLALWAHSHVDNNSPEYQIKIRAELDKCK